MLVIPKTRVTPSTTRFLWSSRQKPPSQTFAYLVVAQLIARSRRTGGRLRTEHFVEPLNIWLNANGAEVDWLQRMYFKSVSGQSNLSPCSIARI